MVSAAVAISNLMGTADEQDVNVSIADLLRARKRDLKKQLKQYDLDFARKHGRLPDKEEKEPIRHLYEAYNAIKMKLIVLLQDMASLKAEKRKLHKLLRSYEKDFLRESKGQVSSYADIKPVASK